MKKFRLLSFLVPGLAFAALSGCGSNGNSTANSTSDTGSTPTPVGTTAAGNTTASTGTTPATGGKSLHLAFVCNNASDYWTIAHAGVDKADKELDNVTVEFKTPGQGTAAEQTQLVNDLLSKGLDGMAISPVDPANQTKLLNTAAAKALVFTQDSDAPKSNRTCYIGTDNKAAGRQAGDLVKKALPNGGKIMVFVGNKDAQNAADRYAGLKEGLQGSKIEIVDIRTDDTDRAKAQSNVSDALVKYPDLAGCVGLWSYNGPAILKAVRGAHKTGTVKIVCFDEEPDTLSGVQSGDIYATVVQQPYEFGYQSIINMSKYLNGDKSVVPANKVITVPTQAITKENVGAFKAKLASILGKK